MEQLGALPSAEVVLDKLKSDGTFDQFRKTCSAAIEAEVSVWLNTILVKVTVFPSLSISLHTALVQSTWGAS